MPVSYKMLRRPGGSHGLRLMPSLNRQDHRVMSTDIYHRSRRMSMQACKHVRHQHRGSARDEAVPERARAGSDRAVVQHVNILINGRAHLQRLRRDCCTWWNLMRRTRRRSVSLSGVVLQRLVVCGTTRKQAPSPKMTQGWGSELCGLPQHKSLIT